MPPNELRGLCFSCGTTSMTFRFDKKGRPYLTCRGCGVKLFTLLEGASNRWLAILVLLAKDQGWKKEWEATQAQVREWTGRMYAERGSPAPQTVVEVMNHE